MLGSIRRRGTECFKDSMNELGKRVPRLGLSFALMSIVGGLMLTACGGSSDSSSKGTQEAPNSGADESTKKAGTNLSRIERDLLAIDKLTDAGDVDKAAAGLVRMRMKGAQFSSDEAAAYRDSLAIAYDKALELDDEGSAKGKAAMKILQSNGSF